MGTEAVNNMSADKINKIEKDIKDIHTYIKKSNLGLRKRIKEIQQEMSEWDTLGGLDEDKGHGKGYMR